jgi:phage terminase large subunit GpA-like protein
VRADPGIDFLEGFLPEELRVWEPPERLIISEWADKYRVLDSATSPEPGPWRTDRTPYARAWMDAFNDTEIEVVVIQTGTQIAKTETLLNVMGFIVDQRPGPCMVVYPTLETAEDISTPTTETARITRELEDCDVVCDFHVPCPHCGEYQPLKFAQVKWPRLEKNDPDRLRRIEEETRYECNACGGEILDRHKAGMLHAGEWVAEREFTIKKKSGSGSRASTAPG